MKILVAPNAFKGTISAEKAARIIQKALAEEKPEANITLCPIADGGDGTCQLLGKHMKLEEVKLTALNPIGKSISGSYFLDKVQNTAYMDVSTVSGIQCLQPEEINAHMTSTFGTGEMVAHAFGMGAEHIVLGLGGSATVDMGSGILRALGYLFLDKKGREIPMFSPGLFSRTAYIQAPVKPLPLRFTCLCDVKNMFFGEKGAIPVFGPQKGLKAGELEQYARDALHFFELLKKKSPFNLEDRPAFGAAGGIALGLSAFFPVELEEGAKFFFEKVAMDQKVRQADWIITGEGKYDSQSAGGKGSYELLQLAQSHGKKTALVSSGREGMDSGFDEFIQLADLNFKASDVREQAERNLYEGVRRWVREGGS